MIEFSDPIEFVENCVSFPMFCTSQDKHSVASTIFWQIASPFHFYGESVVRFVMATPPLYGINRYGEVNAYSKTEKQAYHMYRNYKRHMMQIRVYLPFNGDYLPFTDAFEVSADISDNPRYKRLIVALWQYPRLKRDFNSLKRVI